MAGPVPRSFAEDPLPHPPLGVFVVTLKLLMLLERVLGRLAEGIRPLLPRHWLAPGRAPARQVDEQCVQEGHGSGSHSSPDIDVHIPG